MALNKKILVLTVLTFSLFGSVFFAGKTEALTVTEAKAICDLKIDKATVTSCKKAVDQCAPTNQTCISTAVRKGASVIKECQNQSDPQACQVDYKKACPSGGSACLITFAKTLSSGTASGATTGAAATTLPGSAPSLNSQTIKTANTCGMGADAVNTQFNFGCTGKVQSPVIDIAFAIVKFLTVGVGIALTISIIYAGIMYATSGGNPEQTSKAKSRILNAVIGLVFFLLISAFVQFLVPGGLF